MKELLRGVMAMLNGYCKCGRPYPCFECGNAC